MNFNKPNNVIKVLKSALTLVHPTLMEHGERVAFIVSEMYKTGKLPKNINLNNLVILSLFHDIGAYKTDDIENLSRFEITNTWEHSIYGYLFLKNMVGINEMANGVLYHHISYSQLVQINPPEIDYAAIISLADRLDTLQSTIQIDKYSQLYPFLETKHFSQEFMDVFKRADKSSDILQALRSGSYKVKVEKILDNIMLSKKQSEVFLKLLAFSIDFSSPQTATHSVNIAALSVAIARLMGLSSKEIEDIYWGGMLHDIGKICIPKTILEHEGKLSLPQMEVMRNHVNLTYDIIKNCVSTKVCRIATRHHEREDGSGYPLSLTGSQMTVSEKIVAMADVVSALYASRSYKSAMPVKEISNIISEMISSGKFNSEIGEIIIDNLDELINAMDKAKDPIIKAYQGMVDEYKVIKENLQETINLINQANLINITPAYT